MTNEIRTLIEFGDITGIEMECPTCKVRLFNPMSSAEKVPTACPSCNKPWFSGNMDVHQKLVGSEQVKLLAKTLNLLSSAERGDIHVRLKFHVRSI